MSIINVTVRKLSAKSVKNVVHMFIAIVAIITSTIYGLVANHSDKLSELAVSVREPKEYVNIIKLRLGQKRDE
ncbi:hypothetical protein [Bdellovibrio sp. HCB274]|uniref:hypothetical protein n=1 Tax=Bdellovibrio sp. HCB274 TaxID=3394361 RepID=UPI0039B39BBD